MKRRTDKKKARRKHRKAKEAARARKFVTHDLAGGPHRGCASPSEPKPPHYTEAGSSSTTYLGPGCRHPHTSSILARTASSSGRGA